MKEIGIRKVLGASISQIVGMISTEYLKLITIAVLIALPTGYFLLTNWLKKYAFQISLDAWFFVLPALAILLISLLTVSYQAIKAALMNPVKSLRTE